MEAGSLEWPCMQPGTRAFAEYTLIHNTYLIVFQFVVGLILNQRRANNGENANSVGEYFCSFSIVQLLSTTEAFLQ